MLELEEKKDVEVGAPQVLPESVKADILRVIASGIAASLVKGAITNLQGL